MVEVVEVVDVLEVVLVLGVVDDVVEDEVVVVLVVVDVVLVVELVLEEDVVVVVVELDNWNSNTRLLNLSQTQMLPPASNARAKGPLNPCWLVENVPVE